MHRGERSRERNRSVPYMNKASPSPWDVPGPRRSNVFIHFRLQSDTSGFSPDRVDALVWAVTALSEPEPPTFGWA